MATTQLYVTVKVAWWVRWYLRGELLAYILTGREPDEEKIMARVLKGIRPAHHRGPQA